MWNGQIFAPCGKTKSTKVRDFDDFNKDALGRKIFQMYDTGIYPTAENWLRRWNRVFILK